MAEGQLSCVEPAGGPPQEAPAEHAGPSQRGGTHMEVARAGGKAPDFQGMAYHNGEFKQVKLSDYRGKWTVICFYPGDFTFV